jgi:CubicO group peptidase (beta-lactamase class C family)
MTGAIATRLAALLCAVTVHAADAAPAAIKSVATVEADRFIRSSPGAMAVSIGVIFNGDRGTFHFGTLIPGRAQPPTDATIYPIASITKTFTGVLLAQAVLEHRATLDDDVRKYLHGSYPNLEFQHHPIRLKDLLDHRSGLPFLLPDVPQSQPEFGNNATPWTARVAALESNYRRQDFFDDLHNVVLHSVPGTQVSYSNTGATLMGYILEEIYGQPYEGLLRGRILQPLHMTDTAIVQTSDAISRTARGYDAKGIMMPVAPVTLGAAGGLKSTITDMLAYAAWGMAEKDPAIRLAHQPVVTVAPQVTGLKYPYMSGLNWQEIWATDATGTRRLIWQSGGMDGFASYCIEEPELHVVVVALFNESDASSSQRQQAMINAILTGLDSRAVLLP